MECPTTYGQDCRGNASNLSAHPIAFKTIYQQMKIGLVFPAKRMTVLASKETMMPRRWWGGGQSETLKFGIKQVDKAGNIAIIRFER